MNTDHISIAVNELKSVIKREFGPDAILVLFGSASRGDCTRESDIDVLILLSGAVNSGLEEKIIGLAYDIELRHDVVFGIIIYSQDFWNSDQAMAMPLYQNIAHDGIPV